MRNGQLEQRIERLLLRIGHARFDFSRLLVREAIIPADRDTVNGQLGKKLPPADELIADRLALVRHDPALQIGIGEAGPDHRQRRGVCPAEGEIARRLVEQDVIAKLAELHLFAHRRLHVVAVGAELPVNIEPGVHAAGRSGELERFADGAGEGLRLFRAVRHLVAYREMSGLRRLGTIGEGAAVAQVLVQAEHVVDGRADDQRGRALDREEIFIAVGLPAHDEAAAAVDRRFAQQLGLADPPQEHRHDVRFDHVVRADVAQHRGHIIIEHIVAVDSRLCLKDQCAGLPVEQQGGCVRRCDLGDQNQIALVFRAVEQHPEHIRDGEHRRAEFLIDQHDTDDELPRTANALAAVAVARDIGDGGVAVMADDAENEALFFLILNEAIRRQLRIVFAHAEGIAAEQLRYGRGIGRGIIAVNNLSHSLFFAFSAHVEDGEQVEYDARTDQNGDADPRGRDRAAVGEAHAERLIKPGALRRGQGRKAHVREAVHHQLTEQRSGVGAGEITNDVLHACRKLADRDIRADQEADERAENDADSRVGRHCAHKRNNKADHCTRREGREQHHAENFQIGQGAKQLTALDADIGLTDDEHDHGHDHTDNEAGEHIARSDRGAGDRGGIKILDDLLVAVGDHLGIGAHAGRDRGRGQHTGDDPCVHDAFGVIEPVQVFDDGIADEEDEQGEDDQNAQQREKHAALIAEVNFQSAQR